MYIATHKNTHNCNFLPMPLVNYLPILQIFEFFCPFVWSFHKIALSLHSNSAEKHQPFALKHHKMRK